MDATVWIALWAALFLGTHFAISSATVRPRLINAVGEQPYLGIYSIVAFATFGPLLYEFAYNKHAGPLLWYLRTNAPIRWLAWLLMLVALILFVASLINPNPGGLGAPRASSTEPHGVLKITRIHHLRIGAHADERMGRRRALLRNLPQSRNSRRDASGRPQDPRPRRTLPRVQSEDFVPPVRRVNQRARAMDPRRHAVDRDRHRHRPDHSDRSAPSNNLRRPPTRIETAGGRPFILCGIN